MSEMTEAERRAYWMGAHYAYTEARQLLKEAAREHERRGILFSVTAGVLLVLEGSLGEFATYAAAHGGARHVA